MHHLKVGYVDFSFIILKTLLKCPLIYFKQLTSFNFIYSDQLQY